MRQMKEEHRRKPWFCIGVVAAVCMVFVLAFPSLALAASSGTPTPPDKPDVSDPPSHYYPYDPEKQEQENPDVPDGSPRTDFYIMVLQGKYILTVVVTDQTDGKPLAGVRVELQDPDQPKVPPITGASQALHMTDGNGRIKITLIPNPGKTRRYKIVIDHFGYDPYESDPFTVTGNMEKDVQLIPSPPLPEHDRDHDKKPIVPPAVTAPGAAVSPPAIPSAMPPAIATAPAVNTANGTAPQPGEGTTGGTKGNQTMAGGKGYTSQSAVQNRGETPSQLASGPVSQNGSGHTGYVHWLILAGIFLTCVFGIGRLRRIRQLLKEMEAGEEAEDKEDLTP